MMSSLLIRFKFVLIMISYTNVIGSAVIDYKTTGNLVEDGFIVRRIVAPY